MIKQLFKIFIQLKSKSNLIVFTCLSMALIANASHGQTLTLDSCIALAEANYPQVQQYDLLQRSAEYNLKNAQQGKIPQIALAGQATYQSDVTSVPGGEVMGVEPLNKDQYKVYAEVVQPLTGISIINQQEKIIAAEARVSEADLTAKLYGIRQRVSDLYFGILLMQRQLAQISLTQQDLADGLKTTEAAITYGTALKSSADVLKAEVLQLDQKMIELEAVRQGYMSMLSLFIVREIGEGTSLVLPITNDLVTQINRPEITLFGERQNSLSLQTDLINRRNRPQLNLFLQSGFGRPALDFLNNDFEPYYLGGLQMSWNLSNYYTAKREKQIVQLNQKILESEKQTFVFNTNLSLTQQQSQIDKMNALIEKDQDIIELRERIIKTALGQLENGVMTTTDYRALVNDADRARQDLAVHETELLKYKYDYNITSGN